MKTILATALSLSLLVSGLAVAAPGNPPPPHPAAPARTQPAMPPRHAAPAPAPVVRPPAGPVHAPAARPPLAQAHRAHRKGERLAPNHRGQPVSGWRARGLRAPARGQEWRLLEGQYLRIVSSTGLIVEVVGIRR